MSDLTLSRFLQSLKARQTPALVWYGAPDERVELSGRVLDNWVAKSANFLCDEAEVEVGDAVYVPATFHWSSAALVLAAARCGATVYSAKEKAADAPGDIRVAFGFTPADCAGMDAELYGLVDPAALAMRYMGEVPSGVETVDYTFEVRAFADTYTGFNEPTDSTAVFTQLSHRELMTRVLTASRNISAEVPAGVQALELTAAPATATGLIQLLATLHAGYAAVLLDGRFDFADRREQIYQGERAQIFPLALGS